MPPSIKDPRGASAARIRDNSGMDDDAGDVSSAAAFASLARALTETPGFVPKLQLITAAATELAPCRWASIAVTAHLSALPAKWSASTDPALGAAIADIAGSTGSSPGIDAFERGVTVTCPDLTHEPRFPEYAARMIAETPVRSVLSTAIRIHDVTAGVLTLYAAEAGAFDDGSLERAYLLTEHAAAAIAAELSEDRAHNLEAALTNSRMIGTAVGILIERFRIPQGHAFAKLREASQDTNRKLSDIATEVVETGTLAGDAGEALEIP